MAAVSLSQNNNLQLVDAGGGRYPFGEHPPIVDCDVFPEWIDLTDRQWPGRDVPPTGASSPFVLGGVAWRTNGRLAWRR